MLALLAELLLCPTPHSVLRVLFPTVLLHLRIQVLFHLWIRFAVQAQKGPRHHGVPINMSDSSVEETPPPNRPAGPPVPMPVQEQRGLSYQVSNAVARELDFQGTVLTYLPWDIRALRSIVVSVRAMRPHEWTHPNVLTVKDDASEAGEDGEEEQREEDGHASSEHGHGHMWSHDHDHANDHTAHQAEEMEAGDDELGHGARAGGKPTRRERILARLQTRGPSMPVTSGSMASTGVTGHALGPPLGEEARDRRLTNIVQTMEAEGRTVLTAEEIRTIEVDFPDDDPVNPGPPELDSDMPETDHPLDGPRPPPGPPPGWLPHEDEDDTGLGPSTGTGTEPQAKPRATNPRKCALGPQIGHAQAKARQLISHK